MDTQTFIPSNAPASIAELLKNRTDSNVGNTIVVNQIVDELADAEIALRRQALLTVVRSIEEKEKELQKIKPDNNVYDKEGSVTLEGFSKKSIDQIAKLKQEIAEMTKAIEAAFTDFKWEAVKKLGLPK